MRIWTLHPSHLDPQGHATPRGAISGYLCAVHDEADRRGYVFDRSKVGPVRACGRIIATRGQLEYEWEHLLAKLRRRSPEWYRCARTLTPVAHPSFRIVAGPVAPWERV